MGDGVFVLNGSELVELVEQPYDSEDMLQRLLADYPNLLAGRQMNDADPRRWLLVSREVAIPSEQDGGDRWSLDHLFLDQDAIPTLVEVKRSGNTEIRRKIVGQLLDYAANAVVYWPAERMRAEFEAGCRTRGVEPDDAIDALLGPEGDKEHFWNCAKLNLQAGKIRLVFVADRIPVELQRIVEFLNQQMDPAEVLAVEIKQFVGQNLKTLVPRVIGHTAIKESEPRSVRSWDEATFLAELERRCGPEPCQVASRMIEWARNSEFELKWGSGAVDGSFVVQFIQDDFRHVLFDVFTSGRVFIRMKRLKRKGPFADPVKRQEIIGRLGRIQDISLSGSLLDGEPGFELSGLVADQSLGQFLEVMQWVAAEIRHLPMR